MKTPFTGDCLYKAVRYECSAEPIGMANCHCRDCQKDTGSAYAAELFVPLNAVTITGDVNRGFCPICGSRLFAKLGQTELMAITAGSLDDPSEFKPAIDVYTASAQPWDYMNPELAKFAKIPPFNNLTES